MERKFIILQGDKRCGYCKLTNNEISFYIREIIGECESVVFVGKKEMKFNLVSDRKEQEFKFDGFNLKLTKNKFYNCIINNNSEVLLIGGDC